MSQVVSVRLPNYLLKELRKSSKKNYYMDISEHIRSIIRQKSLQYVYPYKSELAKITKSLENKQTQEKRRAKQDLLEEIKKVLEAEL